MSKALREAESPRAIHVAKSGCGVGRPLAGSRTAPEEPWLGGQAEVLGLIQSWRKQLGFVGGVVRALAEAKRCTNSTFGRASREAGCARSQRGGKSPEKKRLARTRQGVPRCPEHL